MICSDQCCDAVVCSDQCCDAVVCSDQCCDAVVCSGDQCCEAVVCSGDLSVCSVCEVQSGSWRVVTAGRVERGGRGGGSEGNRGRCIALEADASPLSPQDGTGLKEDDGTGGKEYTV